MMSSLTTAAMPSVERAGGGATGAATAARRGLLRGGAGCRLRSRPGSLLLGGGPWRLLLLLAALRHRLRSGELGCGRQGSGKADHGCDDRCGDLGLWDAADNREKHGSVHCRPFQSFGRSRFRVRVRFQMRLGLIRFGHALEAQESARKHAFHLPVLKVQQHRDAQQQAGARGRPRGQRHRVSSPIIRTRGPRR